MRSVVQEDRRPQDIWVVLQCLNEHHPELSDLEIVGLVHQFKSDDMATVEIFGCHHDKIRRRALRRQARACLRHMGYGMEIYPGRDVFHVKPSAPETAHEMARCHEQLRDILSLDWMENERILENSLNRLRGAQMAWPELEGILYDTMRFVSEQTRAAYFGTPHEEIGNMTIPEFLSAGGNMHDVRRLLVILAGDRAGI